MMFNRSLVQSFTKTNVTKRGFWQIIHGKSIGFIEANYKTGFIIKTQHITFRETSSNFASNTTINLSVEHLPENRRTRIDAILQKKTPVIVEFSQELLNSPFKGKIIGEMFVLDIRPLNNEVVNVDLNK